MTQVFLDLIKVTIEIDHHNQGNVHLKVLAECSECSLYFRVLSALCPLMAKLLHIYSEINLGLLVYKRYKLATGSICGHKMC